MPAISQVSEPDSTTWLFASTTSSKIIRAELSWRDRLGNNRDRQPDYTINTRTETLSEIDLLKKRYASENDLEGNVIMKTWGLACWNYMVAICVTLHPANAIDYRSASDNTIRILIENMAGPALRSKQFWCDSSPHLEWHGHSRVFAAFSEQSVLKSTAFDKLSCRVLYGAIWLSLYLAPKESNRRLPGMLPLAYLSALEAGAGIDLSIERSLLSDMRAMTSEQRSSWPTDKINQVLYGVSTDMSLLSWCSICRAQIGWNGLLEASCKSGHPFGKSEPLPLCTILFDSS